MAAIEKKLALNKAPDSGVAKKADTKVKITTPINKMTSKRAPIRFKFFI